MDEVTDPRGFRILGLAGSLRSASVHRGIVRAAHEVAPEWMSCEGFDLGTIPYFNQDVEDGGDPEPVEELRGRIRASDAVLIATPEYDYSIPGVLTAALDWALRSRHGASPFRHKPVGIARGRKRSDGGRREAGGRRIVCRRVPRGHGRRRRPGAARRGGIRTHNRRQAGQEVRRGWPTAHGSGPAARQGRQKGGEVMELNLEGKTAVVTGASRGIGLAVTRALVEEGAFVVAGARHVGDELDELRSSGLVEPVAVDLGDPEGPANLVSRSEARGGADILVNNVGTLTVRFDGFLTVTDEDWLHAFTLNLLAAVRATRAALPLLRARGGGSIVSISSINAFLPDPGIIDYCAAKAALSNFSKALSKEVGPEGIRVNTVSPGPVATPLWLGDGGVAATAAKALGTDKEAAREQVIKEQGGLATGRFTEPREVADLVLFLAGDRAANITGADFVIDGGMVKTL